MHTAEQKLKSEAFGAWPGLLITPFARGWAGPFLSHPLVWYRAVSPQGEEALSPFLCGDRPSVATGQRLQGLVRSRCVSNSFVGEVGLGVRPERAEAKYERVGDSLGTESSGIPSESAVGGPWKLGVPAS